MLGRVSRYRLPQKENIHSVYYAYQKFESGFWLGGLCMVNILSLLIYLILICTLYRVKAHTIFLVQNMVPYIYLIILIIVYTAPSGQSAQSRCSISSAIRFDVFATSLVSSELSSSRHGSAGLSFFGFGSLSIFV